MLQSGVEPNLYTYNARVKTQCAVEDFDAALETVTDMISSQTQPDGTTWQTILAAAYRSERRDVVEQVSFIALQFKKQQSCWSAACCFTRTEPADQF